MRIYKCDRCGDKFAESRPLDAPTSPSADLLEVGLTTKLPVLGRGDRIVIAEVDLCGICVGSLAQWAKIVEL